MRYYLIDNWKFDPDEHNPFQDTTETPGHFTIRVAAWKIWQTATG
jgi:hypothetical protein